MPSLGLAVFSSRKASHIEMYRIFGLFYFSIYYFSLYPFCSTFAENISFFPKRWGIWEGAALKRISNFSRNSAKSAFQIGPKP